MCGRFALSTSMNEVALRMESEPLSDMTPFKPSWNIAPQHLIPVATEIGVDGTSKVGRHFRLMRWGFRPSWGKASHREPINARSETMHEKPMFRGAAQRRRGIVPADGWYEWMTTPQGKTPWYHREESGFSMMAVLWDTWTDAKEHLEWCVVLTQVANEDCRDVHNRMPVLLDEESGNAWLRDGVVPPQPESGTIHRYPVDRMVNNLNHDHAGLVQPIPRLFDHEYGA